MIVKTGVSLFAIAVGIALSSGCSSSDGGTGSTGGNFDCNSGCEKIVAAQCPNDNMDKCMQDCESEIAEAGDCAGSVKSLYACVITLPLTCDADGEAGFDASASLDKCYSQNISYAKCIACKPDPEDDACDSCAKQNCCAEQKAVYDDPSFKDYFLCYNNCQDQTCVSNCVTQYPSIVSKGEAIVACQTNKCASACSGP